MWVRACENFCNNAVRYAGLDSEGAHHDERTPRDVLITNSMDEDSHFEAKGSWRSKKPWRGATAS